MTTKTPRLFRSVALAGFGLCVGFYAGGTFVQIAYEANVQGGPRRWPALTEPDAQSKAEYARQALAETDRSFADLCADERNEQHIELCASALETEDGGGTQRPRILHSIFDACVREGAADQFNPKRWPYCFQAMEAILRKKPVSEWSLAEEIAVAAAKDGRPHGFMLLAAESQNEDIDESYLYAPWIAGACGPGVGGFDVSLKSGRRVSVCPPQSYDTAAGRGRFYSLNEGTAFWLMPLTDLRNPSLPFDDRKIDPLRELPMMEGELPTSIPPWERLCLGGDHGGVGRLSGDVDLVKCPTDAERPRLALLNPPVQADCLVREWFSPADLCL